MCQHNIMCVTYSSLPPFCCCCLPCFCFCCFCCVGCCCSAVTASISTALQLQCRCCCCCGLHLLLHARVAACGNATAGCSSGFLALMLHCWHDASAPLLICCNEAARRLLAILHAAWLCTAVVVLLQLLPVGSTPAIPWRSHKPQVREEFD